MGATAGLAIGIYSTVAGVASDRANARAAESRGRIQADVYGLNATVAEQQAADAIARGQEAEARVRGHTEQLAGRQRAAAAAQGIALDTGSIVQLQGETAQLGELDALTIRNNAKREAWGFQLEAQNDRLNASLARMGAANEAAAYNNRAFSTLLTGGLQTWQGLGDSKRAIEKRKRGRSSSSSSSYDWGE